MQFQQIRNATSIITYADKRFIVDPLFAPKDFFPPIPECLSPDRRWPTADLPFEAEKIVQNLDAVILTHSHIDHIDEFAAKALPKNLKVFVQDELDKKFMQDFGFNDVEILTENGNKFADITLYKTSCLHMPENSRPYYEKFGFRPDAMGVIFKHDDEQTVYLAGDTVWCDFVKNTLDKFSPKTVIINAAAARFEHSDPIIMGKSDIANLRSYAPDVNIVATHMDAVGHATLSRQQLKEFIAKQNIRQQFFIPDDGEIISIN